VTSADRSRTTVVEVGFDLRTRSGWHDPPILETCTPGEGMSLSRNRMRPPIET
jgi:hypothetical protein